MRLRVIHQHNRPGVGADLLSGLRCVGDPIDVIRGILKVVVFLLVVLQRLVGVSRKEAAGDRIASAGSWPIRIRPPRE